MGTDTDIRRGTDAIARGVASLGGSVAKAGESNKKAMGKLERQLKDSATLQAVGLLTETEIDELRKLAELGNEAQAYALERTQDKRYLGIYKQLCDSGFLIGTEDMSGRFHFGWLDAKAYWAIGRFEQRKADEERRKSELERQRKQDRKYAFIQTMGGVALGAILTFLTSTLPSMLMTATL